MASKLQIVIFVCRDISDLGKLKSLETFQNIPEICKSQISTVSLLLFKLIFEPNPFSQRHTRSSFGVVSSRISSSLKHQFILINHPIYLDVWTQSKTLNRFRVGAWGIIIEKAILILAKISTNLNQIHSSIFCSSGLKVSM